MMTRLFLLQGIFNQHCRSRILEFIITRRNSSYTNSKHSVLDNIYIFEVTNKYIWLISLTTGKQQPNNIESGLWCSLALWIWHALVGFPTKFKWNFLFPGFHLTHKLASCRFRQRSVLRQNQYLVSERRKRRRICWVAARKSWLLGTTGPHSVFYKVTQKYVVHW